MACQDRTEDGKAESVTELIDAVRRLPNATVALVAYVAYPLFDCAPLWDSGTFTTAPVAQFSWQIISLSFQSDAEWFAIVHDAIFLGRFLLAGCIAVLCACDRAAPPMAAPMPAVAGGDARRGQQLLAQYQCGACHVIPDVHAALGNTGPSLATFGRQSYIAGHLPNQPDLLVRWLVDPQAMAPGTLMPSMGVSVEDARHMAAYLYTLP